MHFVVHKTRLLLLRHKLTSMSVSLQLLQISKGKLYGILLILKVIVHQWPQRGLFTQSSEVSKDAYVDLDFPERFIRLTDWFTELAFSHNHLKMTEGEGKEACPCEKLIWVNQQTAFESVWDYFGTGMEACIVKANEYIKHSLSFPVL